MVIKKFLSVAVAAAMVMCGPAAAFADTAAADTEADKTAVTAETAAPANPATPADVAGTAYEKAVTDLVEAGVITGDTDGLFHADSNLTRAQACIIIVKSIDPAAALVRGTATQSGAEAGFRDLSGYSWAKDYIGYAVQQGIVKGYPDGTFKPGVKVSVNEMLTMLLRAGRLLSNESGMSYPADYVAAAEKEGILKELGEGYPATATKGMAALMTVSVFDKLKKAAPAEEKDVPQGTDSDVADAAPQTSGMTFASGSFNADVSEFAGKSIAGKVTVYTYGLSKDYSKDMQMSSSRSDFLLDTVYKFKNVTTKAWYKYENGRITSMILPKDAGFSGRIYCVVNDTCKTLNGAGEKVTGFETLTATKAITWLGSSSLADPVFTEGDGRVYEMQASSGEVRNIAIPGATAKNKYFKELTSGWQDIFEYEDEVIRLGNASGELITVAENATVYTWDAKEKEYKSGRLSALKSGKYVRAYAISEDEPSTAFVLVVKD
ncbi:MAG: S-layer homology domain-containing protein [Clostridia bacterium]|nr:S-layer homology domain-containing protein [Clostridia bacterium]